MFLSKVALLQDLCNPGPIGSPQSGHTLGLVPVGFGVGGAVLGVLPVGFWGVGFSGMGVKTFLVGPGNCLKLVAYLGPFATMQMSQAQTCTDLVAGAILM